MNVAPICYGTNSPFALEEREAIEAIFQEVQSSDHPQAAALATTIRQQMVSLEWLGEVMAQKGYGVRCPCLVACRDG